MDTLCKPNDRRTSRPRIRAAKKERSSASHVSTRVHCEPVTDRAPLSAGAPVFRKDASALEKDIRRLGGKPEPSAFTDDLNRMRTFELPRIVSGTAKAEFFLLIGPGGKAEAKFISGSDSLKGVQKALESTNYNQPFPDEPPREYFVVESSAVTNTLAARSCFCRPTQSLRFSKLSDGWTRSTWEE